MRRQISTPGVTAWRTGWFIGGSQSGVRDTGLGLKVSRSLNVADWPSVLERICNR